MGISKIMFASLFVASSLFAVININTATKEELMSIKGIGESKANAIIEYRKVNKFNSIEDIKNVSGIGDNTFEKIKGDLSTTGKTTIESDNVKEKAAKKTKDMANSTKDKTKDVNNNIKNKAKDMTKSVKEKSKNTKENLKDKITK